MKSLFESTVIGGIPLQNRFIRSATMEAPFETDGRFADNLLKFYEPLAANGVGAIITGMVGVDENSRVLPSMVDGANATFITEMQRITEKVHQLGGRLVVQISHCGLKANVIEGDSPLGPSAAISPSGKDVKEMTAAQIKAVTASFAAVALNCKNAGANGVQLHAAHGYLLSQFLSPYYNKRTDAYGGDIKGRAKIVMEVVDAVKAAVGADFPIWIKINGTDLHEESITAEEFLWVGRELDKRGIAAVEVSGGISVDAKSSPIVKGAKIEGYFAPQALALAKAISASVISVGGFCSPAGAETWLNKGDIAGISMCRPFIAEPDLIRRWQNGDTQKSYCIACNSCFDINRGIACRHYVKTKA